MKIKKTVTAKVIAANRANGQKATGPRNTTAVTQNARTHGLLSKYILFQGEEEKKEFDTLLDELEREQQPAGPTERALVEELASCFWKVRITNDLENREVADRQKASKAILETLAESNGKEQLQLFTRWDGSPSPAQRGWECQELIVRTGTRNSEQENESGDKKGKAGHVQIEAKLNTSLDGILRYQAAAKRDLYRALAALRDIRRERNGG